MTKLMISILISGLSAVLLAGCSGRNDKSKSDINDSTPTIMKQDFGSVDSKPVYLFTIKNKNGITIRITQAPSKNLVRAKTRTTTVVRSAPKPLMAILMRQRGS